MPSFFDLIDEHAAARAEKLALISELDGTRTYGELATRAAQLGVSFGRELGLGVGSRNCIWMVNRPEWIEASIASAAAGIPIVPTNPEWADKETEFVLRHSGARSIVCDGDLVERALGLRERIPELEHVVVVGDHVPVGATRFSDLVDAAPSDAKALLPDVIPEDIPGQLMYTSGTTTGRPKAVRMSREMSNMIPYEEMFGVSPSDRSLFVTPLFHGNAAGALGSALTCGASAVFQRRFSASRFWDLVDRTRPTYLFTLAPIVNILLGLPPSAREREHNLRVIIALGAAGAAPIIEERFGAPVIDWYGMTEAGMGTYTRLDEERRPGSAGRPFSDSAMVILREDGTRADPGETGEVCFESASIGFEGYVEDSEATSAALRDGYFHTGDLGKFDADGFFYFVDRIKDIVRRGGENISSAEIETVFRQHDDVAEISIVGRPDPVLGERVVAFVVPAEGAAAPDAQALAKFGEGQLAPYKLPEEVIPIDELPRTATGKVQKFRLREML